MISYPKKVLSKWTYGFFIQRLSDIDKVEISKLDSKMINFPLALDSVLILNKRNVDRKLHIFTLANSQIQNFALSFFNGSMVTLVVFFKHGYVNGLCSLYMFLKIHVSKATLTPQMYQVYDFKD